MGFHYQSVNAFRRLNLPTMKKYIALFIVIHILTTACYGAPKPIVASNPCYEFNILNNKIRDGQIPKKDALKQVQTLISRIRTYYYMKVGKDTLPVYNIFPIQGYGSWAVGGKNGSGYIASGYDYFAGNKHGGHPAHDIFIKDKNQDCLNDKNGKPEVVCSAYPGIVVATETSWQPASIQRGGNYIWIYVPHFNKLVYYAHNKDVFVKPGDVVRAGDKIATVGRSGANAAKKRSPTHLHYMELLLDEASYPYPVDPYRLLVTSSKK
jgi:peptidoglycan LD-endopeptidase LytH